MFGVVSLVICAICLFIAIERYNDNASNVAAINSLRNSSPFGQVLGGMTGESAQMKPATPAATKYALLFAVISGLGGVYLLVQSSKK